MRNHVDGIHRKVDNHSLHSNLEFILSALQKDVEHHRLETSSGFDRVQRIAEQNDPRGTLDKLVRAFDEHKSDTFDHLDRLFQRGDQNNAEVALAHLKWAIDEQGSAINGHFDRMQKRIEQTSDDVQTGMRDILRHGIDFSSVHTAIKAYSGTGQEQLEEVHPPRLPTPP